MANARRLDFNKDFACFWWGKVNLDNQNRF
jgi:hypothetical protein